MRYRIKLELSRLMLIPKKLLLFLLLLCWLAIMVLIALITPTSKITESLYEEKIIINSHSIFIYDSHSIGNRFRIVLKADEIEYYAWYPRDSYSKYKETLAELQNINSSVNLEVLVSNDFSLWDTILNRKQVYDVRCGSEVYYNLEDYLISSEKDKKETLFVFPIVLVAWLGFMAFTLFVYKVVVITRK